MRVLTRRQHSISRYAGMSELQAERSSQPVQPNLASDTPRVAWIDTAKGICIIFVVMMHTVRGVEAACGEIGLMHNVVSFAAPFRMPDFFLISGLFLSRVLVRDWRSFADKRILHFVYFYVLWLTIQFAFRAPGIAMEAGATAALQQYLQAFIHPWGTLWFIYMLPVFAIAAKLAFTHRIPHWLVLAVAAVLQAAPVHTEFVIIDSFAERFVFFYAGYALAPGIFRFADWIGQRPLSGLCILAVWAVINGFLVFNGGYAAAPSLVTPGYAALPGVSLVLGFLGAVAIASSAALLSRRSTFRFLSYLGANSIVVYLAFFLPMAAGRSLLLKLGVNSVDLIAVTVNVMAVVCPLILLWLTQWTGRGTFLFTRPAWAHLKPRPATSQPKPAAAATPAARETPSVPTSPAAGVR